MKQFLLSFMLIFGANMMGLAQVGGDNVYEFLNFSPSARITALGGNLITIQDDDVSLAYANPAALNKAMHGQITFNHNIHLAGINHGYAAYGHFVEKWATTFHGGIQYLTYGEFDLTDDIGNVNGTFKAAEYALTLGAGKALTDRYSVGANLKFITSQFETYNSLGLAADVSAMYYHPEKFFGITFLAKNIGTQLSTYRVDNREDIPFELQVGVSKKLRYLPFRFSVVYHDLQRWNITYDDPNAPDESTFFIGEEPNGDSNPFFDNLVRHFIFNGEFLFGKKENFRVRLGYNHFRKQELSVANLRSLAGFSFGFGLKIKRFRIEYGQAIYHLAGSMNHFSISTNLKEFKK